MNPSTADTPFSLRSSFRGENLSDFKGCYSNEEGLVILTGGEEEEGEKVNLKICLAGELNPNVQRERQEH